MRNDLHVTGIRLKKLSYLEKKALNPHCFFFGLTLKNDEIIIAHPLDKLWMLPKSVALCFGFYGAQVRLHTNF